MLKKNLLRIMANALFDIVGNGRFADSVLRQAIRNERTLQPNDTALVAEGVYDILRNWRRIWYAFGQDPTPELPTIERLIVAWARLRGVPLHQSVGTLKTHDSTTLIQRWNTASGNRSLQYSVPDWLDTIGFATYSDQWESILTESMQEPPIVVRLNTLVTDEDSAIKALAHEGILTIPLAQSVLAKALRYDGQNNLERVNIFSLEAFKHGLLEMHDAGSQMIAPFVDIEPGMRVVDACAGSGGKTLHCAALMNNKGKIIALDTEEWKLKDLTKRAARAKASCIETRTISSTKIIKRLYNSADRVLLDVPCSGTGVLRRNPDAKWHLHSDDITRFITIQRDILQRYSAMTEIGGKLVYSTCSLLHSEGEDQIEHFMKKNNGAWEVEEQIRINPNTNLCADVSLNRITPDAFYIARLRRIR